MNLFKLMATLGLDDTEYKKKLADAEKKTEGMGNAVSKVGGVIKKAAIPVLIGAMGKSVIETGMSFEASMSQVAATMGMSADEIRKGSKEFELLKDAAKEAGSTTKFTATESAEALNYLALAGYDAETAVATLPTVLNLAAAGGMDLAYASDLVTDSMSALGLETKDANKFTDELAKTSQRSNTSVSQLGEAILTVGGTAKVMAGGTVEMNTQLGILADAGIKGAEGGTALRNVLLALSAPTDKAAKLMKQLGLETYDANGNLRPTNEIFTDLNKILGTMTQEEKTNVLNNLFNKVDLKAANALLAKSGERFNQLSGEITNSSGAAETMAKTMNDNLQGALVTLGSAFDGLKTEIFETFGEPAKNLVNLFATGIQNITQAFKEGKLDNVLALIGAGLAGIITYLTIIKGYAIATAVIGMVKTLVAAASMIKSVSGAMAILNAVMMANPIGLVIGLIAGLVAAFVYLWQTNEGFRQFWINAWEMIKNAFGVAWDFIKAGWQSMVEWFGSLGEKLNEWKAKWLEVWQAIKDFFSGIWEWIKGQWTSLISWLSNLGAKIQEFKNNWVNRWNEIKENVRTVISNIITFFAELPGKLWTIFTNVIQKTATWVFEMGKKGGEAAKSLFDAVMNGLASLPGKILELGKKIPSMLWEGIKSMTGWLGSKVSGFVDSIIGGRSLSLDVNAQPFTAMNGYSMAAAGNGARMSRLSNSMSSNMNVSLNIGGREFDRLVIKTVTDNYGKIENIVQSKERGRR